MRPFALCAAIVLAGCSSSEGETTAPSAGGSGGVAGSSALIDGGWPDANAPDSGETGSGPCPSDMQEVEAFCVDRYEAPNVAGALPLVMYTFDESSSWCEARGKRLCFDDEWTRACAGIAGSSYPYGDVNVPGICNDDKIWKVYDQAKLDGWPWSLPAASIETLDALLEAARAVGAQGTIAADHVEELYQGEGSGLGSGCAGLDEVFDLTGNVEEWTRRRDGGSGAQFSGSLKGRYWAEPRTCQSAVETHGNGFRFYEIGFRCCRDPAP